MKPELIRAVKGTRDFYPEDMAFRNWLYSKIREVSESFGYQEYEAPLLEPLELYAAKSGEELVKEQAFVLQDRRGELIALRPELTPSLARMVAQRRTVLPRPVRWYSFGPFWRYERPQRGRSREFFQWNIDILGTETPQADAELVAVGVEFFKAVGLSSDEVVIKVNNRRFMEKQLADMGLAGEMIISTFRFIDRREKMKPKAWEEYGQEIGLAPHQIAAIYGLLDRREYESDELDSLFTTMADLGVSDYVEFDPNIIRGLDYYTGTVCEAHDRDGEFRSILGGGRYDNLIADVGSAERISGVGWAMGDAVIKLVLQKYGKIPRLPASSTRLLVTLFDADLYRHTLRLTREFRQAGINTELYLEAVNLKKQLKYANRLGIPYVAILGPDEATENKVTLKNMQTGSQETLSLQEAIETLRG